MLKKSLVLGAIAAMSMVSLAPAAFAGDQVQGNTTITTIEAGVSGNGNRTNIYNSTNVNQSQSQYKAGTTRYSRYGRRYSRQCKTGDQTQGNTTDTAINVGVVGNRNRTNVRNTTNVNQGQVASCF